MFKFKHPEYVPVHVLLILGSIFMLFPFIWMITTSFKSQDEILTTSKSIVLLPDLARPSFLNGEEETARIERKKEEAKAWEAEQARPQAERNKKIQAPFQWLDNYLFALKAQPFYRFFLNTIFVTITVTTVSLFFASLAAYAFAFFNFPFKNAMFMMMLGTMMLPQQALLIPNYIFLSKLGWVNTYMALIVPWLASAYSVFFLRKFFLQLKKTE